MVSLESSQSRDEYEATSESVAHAACRFKLRRRGWYVLLSTVLHILIYYLDYPEIMFGLQTLLTDVFPDQDLLACALLYRKQFKICQVLLKAWSTHVEKTRLDQTIVAIEKEIDIARGLLYPKANQQLAQELFGSNETEATETRHVSWIVEILKSNSQQFATFEQSVQEYRILLKLPNSFVYL